ncbi:hypothetical protein Daus18300_003795 [Diaporthe australafricana]|uniref:FAD-binding PCMH-type domain-containing protein n=1 Tax=Diaporthe australafricana TaxID=127596 RepID=A0ABR3XD86_9PEZI
MAKRNLTGDTAHTPVQAPKRSVKGSPRTQKGDGVFFLASRDEDLSLTAVPKTLLALLVCIQLDYFFNVAAGSTLLSYRQERDFLHDVTPIGSRYNIGPWDVVFVALYTFLILLLRKLVTQRPRAIASFFGAKSPERFTEQLFSFVYFSSSTTFGLIIAQSRHTWSMTARDLIAEVETGTLDGNVKCFYLIQAAFWVQEALVVGFQLEKPREDYLQLIFHHVITLVAIGLSYGGKYTDLGIMILVTHDASDAVLGAAKLLRYVRSGLTGLAWLIFLFTWLYTRHYLMIPVIYLTWQFSTELDSRDTSAVTVGGGMLMKDILDALQDKGLTAVSGASPDVAIGGYLTGGGHSVLSATQGLAADNVVQVEMVTPQGDIVTANECQNSDLFWAVRGGGGGTFGVITKATLRTFPSPPIGSMALTIPLPTDDLLWVLTTKLFQVTPVLADISISGYIYAFPENSPFFQSGPVLIFSLVGMNQPASQVLDALKNTDIWPEIERLLEATSAYPTMKDYDNHYAWWLDNVDKTPAGTDFMAASRLLNTEVLSQPFEKLKLALKAAAGTSGLSGILGAGPGVWNARPRGGGNAVNPAWRNNTVVHLVFGAVWMPADATQEQENLAQLEQRTQALRELAPDSGCYVNEAFPNEPDFQHAFWGDQ